MNEIISISMPQVEDDIDVYEALRTLLATFDYEELDMSVEYETDSIRYRFQRK